MKLAFVVGPGVLPGHQVDQSATSHQHEDWDSHYAGDPFLAISGHTNEVFLEMVSKEVASCGVCMTCTPRRGLQTESCDSRPIPEYPFSSVVMDFGDIGQNAIPMNGGGFYATGRGKIRRGFISWGNFRTSTWCENFPAFFEGWCEIFSMRNSQSVT